MIYYTSLDAKQLNTIPNPCYLRKSEKALKRLQKGISRKKKGSSNRKKAIDKLGRKHLKVSRQRSAIRCWENLGIQSVHTLIPIHYEGTLKSRLKIEEIQYGEQTSGTNPGNG